MKSFILGFLVAIGLFLTAKEYTGYIYLTHIDKYAKRTETNFSYDNSHENLADIFEHFLMREYLGEPLTGRCNARNTKYYQCDKFQIFIGKTFHGDK